MVGNPSAEIEVFEAECQPGVKESKEITFNSLIVDKLILIIT